MTRNHCRVSRLAVLVTVAIVGSAPAETAQNSWRWSAPVNQVLEWNQIFIDTLIATNTANSSSQRLGAIVHTAIFDAYNGIERRYTSIFFHAQPRRRVAPRCGGRCGLHGAGRAVPNAAAGAGHPLWGVAGVAGRRM
jgi:hypothetical protein